MPGNPIEQGGRLNRQPYTAIQKFAPGSDVFAVGKLPFVPNDANLTPKNVPSLPISVQLGSRAFFAKPLGFSGQNINRTNYEVATERAKNGAEFYKKDIEELKRLRDNGEISPGTYSEVRDMVHRDQVERNTEKYSEKFIQVVAWQNEVDRLSAGDRRNSSQIKELERKIREAKGQ